MFPECGLFLLLENTDKLETLCSSAMCGRNSVPVSAGAALFDGSPEYGYVFVSRPYVVWVWLFDRCLMDQFRGVGKLIASLSRGVTKMVDSLKFMCSVCVRIGYERFV